MHARRCRQIGLLYPQMSLEREYVSGIHFYYRISAGQKVLNSREPATAPTHSRSNDILLLHTPLHPLHTPLHPLYPATPTRPLLPKQSKTPHPKQVGRLRRSEANG